MRTERYTLKSNPDITFDIDQAGSVNAESAVQIAKQSNYASAFLSLYYLEKLVPANDRHYFKDPEFRESYLQLGRIDSNSPEVGVLEDKLYLATCLKYVKQSIENNSDPNIIEQAQLFTELLVNYQHIKSQVEKISSNNYFLIPISEIISATTALDKTQLLEKLGDEELLSVIPEKMASTEN